MRKNLAWRPLEEPASDFSLLSSISEARSKLEFSPNQTIFMQDAESDSAFYIHKGLIKISAVAKSGQEALLFMLGPGMFFGESSMFPGARRRASAISMTRCVIERIEGSALRQAFSKESRLGQLLIENLIKRNRRLQEDLTDLHFHSTEKRLARVLARLAAFGRQESSEIPPISQGLLAQRVGTTRTRVNFFMNRFRRLGMIQYRGGGKIVVHRSLLDFIGEW